MKSPVKPPPKADSKTPPKPEPKTRTRRAKAAPAFRKAAQAHAIEALEVLASIALGAGSESARVSAANAILDRAYGKPTTGTKTVAGEGEESGPAGPMEVRWLDSEEP